MHGIRAVEKVVGGASTAELYNQYLNTRGAPYKMTSRNPTQRALIRICCNLRYHKIEEAKRVIEASKKLPVSFLKIH